MVVRHLRWLFFFSPRSPHGGDEEEFRHHQVEFEVSTFRNNQKGLAVGVVIFTILSLAQVIFYLYSPTWLMLRTDVEQAQCWRSDGIRQTKVRWGSSEEHCHHAIYTPPSSFCDADPSSLLCKATQRASICTATNIFILTICLGFQLRAMLCGKKRRQRLDGISTLVTFFMFVSVILGIATLYIMFASPLYSLDYLDQVAKEEQDVERAPPVAGKKKHHGGDIHFEGFATCAFQSPFADLYSMLHSSALRCIFPGQAALIAMTQVITSTIAFIFASVYALAERNEMIRILNQQELIDSSPLLLTQAMSPRRRLSSSKVSQNERIRKYGSDDQDNDDDYEDRLDIHFSMFGEFERRLERYQLRSFQRFLLAAIAPLVLITLHTAVWIAYLLNGIQILTGITVSFHQYNGNIYEFFKEVFNLFNFTPMTTTLFFWNAEARLIASLTFAAIVLLPLVKMLIWVWFLFVPSRALFRSRLMFFADISGKFQMANLYALTFMSTAMSFHRQIQIPFSTDTKMLPLEDSLRFSRVTDSQNDSSSGFHLPWDYHPHNKYQIPFFQVDIKSGMNPGFGSWMFEVTFIVSLLIGQILVTANTYAGEWFENAKRKETSTDSRIDHAAAAASVSPSSPYAPTASRVLRHHSTPRLTTSNRIRVEMGENQQESNMTAATAAMRSPFLPRSLSSFPSATPIPIPEGMPLSPRTAAATIANNQMNYRARTSGRIQPRLSSLTSASTDVYLTPPNLIPVSSVGTDELNNQGGLMRKGMHPYALVLSDRTIYPERGVRLRLTLRGKFVMLCALFFSGVLLLVCQSSTIFRVHVNGMLGVVKGKSSPNDFSLLRMVSTLYYDAKWDGGNSLQVSGLFFVTTCFVPFVRVVGLALLWTLPLTLEQSRRLFHVLEILSAWSSLDVFWMSLLVICFQLKSTMEQIVNDFIPEMSKVMKEYLPFGLGDIYADIHLAPLGFAVLTVAIFFDKLVAHIIFEQAVASISERIADETLNDAIARGVASVQEDEEDDYQEMFETGGAGTGVTFSNSAHQNDPDLPDASFAEGDDFELPFPTRQDYAPSEDDIIEAASTILSTNAVAYFGPVERYVSALMPSKMYAGFPRSAWSSVGRRLGLVDDADAVAQYNEFGITGPRNGRDSNRTMRHDGDEEDLRFSPSV